MNSFAGTGGDGMAVLRVWMEIEETGTGVWKMVMKCAGTGGQGCIIAVPVPVS